MTNRIDIDGKLLAWMELMPDEAPDRLVDAVMDEVERVRQQRRSPWARWAIGGNAADAPTGSRPAWLVPVLVALVLLAVAIGGAPIGARLLQPTPRPGPRIDQIVPLSPMREARATPVVASLVDGRALILAGSPGAGAELFDPGTGEHTAIAGPPHDAGEPAIYAAATLGGGDVLVLAPGSSWLFDPTGSSFEPLPALRVPRDRATVVALPDGRALISGGLAVADPSSSLASAEIFDPTTRTFAPAADMDWARDGHAAVALADGRVVILGGITRIDGGHIGNSRMGIYAPGMGSVSATGDLPYLDGAMLATALPDGRVFLATAPHPFRFASEAAIFDPEAHTFTRSIPLPREVGSVAPLGDGRVLLAGAWDDGRWVGVFDPKTETTTDIAGSTAWSPTAARLADGRVLLAGGLAAAQPRGATQPAPGPVSSMQVFQ